MPSGAARGRCGRATGRHRGRRDQIRAAGGQALGGLLGVVDSEREAKSARRRAGRPRSRRSAQPGQSRAVRACPRPPPGSRRVLSTRPTRAGRAGRARPGRSRQPARSPRRSARSAARAPGWRLRSRGSRRGGRTARSASGTGTCSSGSVPASRSAEAMAAAAARARSRPRPLARTRRRRGPATRQPAPRPPGTSARPQLETTMPPVRSASRAARIAATSACAVGSESRTVVFTPLPRIVPFRTTSAPNGPCPASAFSQARRTASATSSSVVGVTGDKLP